ncbi:MAG: hypothetical protein KAS32_00895 [Candidatus Peribacteraceae bacterium]|nr:hypothetical protein [Candidatus Peribacteraceae bacterium]
MAIADDFSVTTGGDIRHESGSTTYTVLELHRWLQDLADDEEASGNDLLDITSSTPSERSTDNIITLLGSYNIDDDASEYFYDGSITQGGGDVVYSGLVVVGSLASTTTMKIVQNNTFYDDQTTPFWGTGLNEDAGANILLRVLVKTRTAGADIDGKRIRVQARTYGDTYAEFSLTMGLGNATAAIFTNDDLNNATVVGTVSGWTVNNTEGRQGIDIDNDTTDEYYYSKWDRVTTTGGSGNINDVYEWAKYVQRDGTAETIHTMNGELFRGITHSFLYDNELVDEPVEDETFTWGTGATAGSGILLALYDNGDVGEFFLQLLTGVAPTDGLTLTGGTSTATVDVDGSVTSRTLAPCFLGTSTGSNLIGAFGVGVDTGDTSVGDQYFDLDDNGPVLPPNNQTFTVGGLVYVSPGVGDRVLVGPKDTGDAYNFNQFTSDIALTGGEGTVDIETGGGAGDETSVPSDTPTAGTFRILDTGGVYQRVEYTGYTSTSFTGCTGVPATALNANIFLSYIDDIYDENAGASDNELDYTAVYSSSRDLFVRVRDGGATPIKTFQTAAVFGAGGGSVTAIRTSDE